MIFLIIYNFTIRRRAAGTHSADNVTSEYHHIILEKSEEQDMSLGSAGDFGSTNTPEEIKASIYKALDSIGGYENDEYRFAECKCGSIEFKVSVTPETWEAVKRICIKCGKQHFICDSEEFWDENLAEPLECQCSSEVWNLGAGFSLYQDSRDIRWTNVVGRCCKCGKYTIAGEWKVGYSPSEHLLDQL
jgi:hypothetical protein